MMAKIQHAYDKEMFTLATPCAFKLSYIKAEQEVSTNAVSQ